MERWRGGDEDAFTIALIALIALIGSFVLAFFQSFSLPPAWRLSPHDIIKVQVASVSVLFASVDMYQSTNWLE